jgi:hypothetical protein
MDLKTELEKADADLQNQLARSNFIVRWIARKMVESKYRDNIKRGITHGTDILEELMQKL